MPESLKLKSVNEARELFFTHLGEQTPAQETVSTIKSIGRVLAMDIVAKEYLPPFSRSSMDGYAVRAGDTSGASENLPVHLKIVGELPMGAVPDIGIKKSESALIHTGGMLADGADAVVMLEQSRVNLPGELEVFQSVVEGENVIFKGEDVCPGDVVLAAGKLIRPAEVGGLFALGYTRVKVAKKPVFAILSSGDEVVPPQQNPELGQVRDINSGALAVLFEQSGATYKLYPIIPDDQEQMQRAVRQAYGEADAVVITAGSATSSRDMTADVIDQLGKPGVLVHGINIRPGKPTILAVCGQKPVIGLPGNPISALVIAQLLIKPLINRMLGSMDDPILPLVKAILVENVLSQAGREEWIPVKLSKKEFKVEARPIFFKSNLIFQLSNADGLMRIEANETAESTGSEVDVLLL
jgi:molybdopterin molybdotransferase